MQDKFNLGLVFVLESVLKCKHRKTLNDLFCWILLMILIRSTTIHGVEDIL